jgi:hypothetical protein
MLPAVCCFFMLLLAAYCCTFPVYAVLMMLLLSLLPLRFVIDGFGYYVQLAHILFPAISTNLLCHLSSWYYFVYLVGATLLMLSLQTHVIVNVVATYSSQPLNASLLFLLPDQTFFVSADIHSCLLIECHMLLIGHLNLWDL